MLMAGFFVHAGKLSSQSKLHIPSATHQPQDEGNPGGLAGAGAGQVQPATRDYISDCLNHRQVS